jgi:YD repeat-containing protein
VDWKLLYHSDRTPAATDQRTLDIPISGAKIPKSLKRMKLEVFIAGRRIAQSLPVKPEQTYTFTWDGLDAFGRRPAGAQTANLRVGYVYDGVYEQTERFGALGTGVAIDGRRTREEVVLWQEHQIFLGAFDARVLGLGGWCLESQHAYDPVGRILYLGNGERHSASAKGSNLDHLTISTVAGGGPATKLDLGDGGPALAARLENPDSRPGFGLLRRRVPEYWWPRGLAVGPDGTIFIADHNQRIRRVDPDGTITTIAGGGRKTDATGRALEIELIGPRAIALAPDGSMYIAETRKHRIRRLTPDGMLTNIAGASESGGFAGDGGPALKADLNHPTGLAVAPDGTLYIADQSNHRIRRVTPDGVITTIAGRSAKEGYSGDHGLATQAELYWPTSLALAADGSLYVSDQGNYVIRRISPAGVITTVAGNYRKTWSHNFGGDGGSALKADFDEPTGVAIAADGTLYIADQFNHRIRCVGPDGVIRTLAGASQKKENGDFSGDGGPALLAKLSKPTGLAFGPDGSLYFYDASQQPANESNVAHLRQRIRRIAPPMPGFTNAEIAIPSPDGKELIKFDAVGKHLETLDAVTKKTKMRFAYDKAGRLAKIEDAAGQAMTIERDQHGIVNAFVVRRGERTTVKLGANGFLAGLTYPGGNEVRIASTTQGLLKYLHNLP